MEDKQNNQASAPELADLTGRVGDRPRMNVLPKIVLASGSPRRAEILRTITWPFEMMPPDIDETRHAGEDPVTYVKRLARAKAEAVAQRAEGSLIVAADTTVVCGKGSLEK